jgi:RNA polymerase sigma factor (sigma-70 family)
MKELKTTIATKDGKSKVITVLIDDTTANLLEKECDEEVTRQYILEEYKASLLSRKEKRRHIALDEKVENYFSTKNDTIDEAIDSSINAEKLYTAMQSLSAEQRDLVYRIFFLDEKQADIAKEMGVGESAIRSRLAKIYEKMKKSF